MVVEVSDMEHTRHISTYSYFLHDAGFHGNNVSLSPVRAFFTLCFLDGKSYQSTIV